MPAPLAVMAAAQKVMPPSKPSPTSHKEGASSSATTATQPQQPQCSLDEDMVYIADGIRLTPATRTALALYDARSLEDFCCMREHDFESMLLSETRLGRPICPLQQRKIHVLLQWIHDVANDTALQRAAKAFSQQPNTSKPQAKVNEKAPLFPSIGRSTASDEWHPYGSFLWKRRWFFGEPYKK